MSELSADQIIERLELRPHPEGGFYRETYRAADVLPGRALPAPIDGDRACSTAIYFLLSGGQFSALHRLRSDELWHFHLGAPLEIIEIAPDGRLVVTRLGPDLLAGERPQVAVPAGHWFGARLTGPERGSIGLVGCTVAPGFDFADLEVGRRDRLIKAYPQHESVIRALTRPAEL